jgi:hypothetical protein
VGNFPLAEIRALVTEHAAVADTGLMSAVASAEEVALRERRARWATRMRSSLSSTHPDGVFPALKARECASARRSNRMAVVVVPISRGTYRCAGRHTRRKGSAGTVNWPWSHPQLRPGR